MSMYQDKAGFNPIVGSVEKAGVIEQRISEAFKNMEEFRAIIAGLQVGLQSVLTPQMKESGGNAVSTPRPILAPMADRLDELNAGLVHSISLLRDIHSRIAL